MTVRSYEIATHRRTARPQYNKGAKATIMKFAKGVLADTKKQYKKKGGSKTATKTKLQGPPIKRDGPVSESWYNYGSLGNRQVRVRGALKDLSGIQGFNTNSVQRITPATSGAQDYKVAGAFFGYDDITQMLTAAATFVQASTATYKNFKIGLESCKSNIMFTNQTNDVVRMTLYDVVIRQDSSNVNYRSPEAAWFQGLTDMNQSTAGFYPGATPFQCSAFVKLYKVKRITTVQLHTGGHHIHNVYIKPNRNFSNEELLDQATAGSAFGQLSCFTVMVVHGYPTNNNVQAEITTAKVAVDAICTKQYKWRVLAGANSSIAVVNNLVAAPANSNTINDLTGVVAAITTT